MGKAAESRLPGPRVTSHLLQLIMIDEIQCGSGFGCVTSYATFDTSCTRTNDGFRN